MVFQQMFCDLTSLIFAVNETIWHNTLCPHACPCRLLNPPVGSHTAPQTCTPLLPSRLRNVVSRQGNVEEEAWQMWSDAGE